MTEELSELIAAALEGGGRASTQRRKRQAARAALRAAGIPEAEWPPEILPRASGRPRRGAEVLSETLSVRVTPLLLEELEEAAAARGVTTAEAVTLAVTAWIDVP